MVLGPVNAVSNGHAGEPDGTLAEFDGPSASLLTVLALHKGERVSKQYLHEVIWRGAVGVNAVETTVRRIRNRLGLRAHDTSFLATDRGGYRLAATTDIQQFEQELELGQQAFEAHLYEEALVSYETALSLWRGVPGAGLLDDAYEVRPAIEELNTGRWTARLNRLIVLAALERWDSALRTADRMLADEPLTERVLLIKFQALERLRGAQSAYNAVREASERMRNEHGSEPSQELRNYRDKLLVLMSPEVEASRGSVAAPASPSSAVPDDEMLPPVPVKVDHNLPAATLRLPKTSSGLVRCCTR